MEQKIQRGGVPSQGLAYRVNKDGVTCAVTGQGTCKDLDIVIPEEIDGYRVTAIFCPNFAWGFSKRITSVIVADSVTEISRNAFAYRPKLARVVLPRFLTSIEESTFAECVSLTQITVPEAVTAIGKQAFVGCANLTQVTLPKSLSCIDDCAFAFCGKLERIHYEGTKQKWKSVTLHENWRFASSLLAIRCTKTGDTVRL